MDRISCLAFLLYQVNVEEVTKASLQLLSGEASIKELSSNSLLLPYIQEAEKKLKNGDYDKDDVYNFVEDFLFVY